MEPKRQPNRNRLVALLVFVVAVIIGFLLLRDRLSLDNLTQYESALEEFGRRQFLLCLVVAGLLYVTVAALSLPFATVLTVVYGKFFGFWVALPLVNVSATLGATGSFLMSRYLFRDFMEDRYGKVLEGVQKELARDGIFYLFMLRLSPIMPFFVVNPVMGLTMMKTRSFFIISLVGMLPGGALYTLFGSALPGLASLKERGWGDVMSPLLIVSFALLGIFPLVVRKVSQWGKSGAK